MRIESVVLTGGASRRMGEDKASLLLDGVPLGERVAGRLAEAGFPPTILGPTPIRGFPFLQDRQLHQGPLAALRGFEPNAPLVFVAACDLPLFDPRIVEFLAGCLGDSHAAIPIVGGREQPLCGLYRSTALELLQGPLAEARSLMAFLDALEYVAIDEAQLAKGGLDPVSVRGVNTREELEELLGKPGPPKAPPSN